MAHRILLLLLAVHSAATLAIAGPAIRVQLVGEGFGRPVAIKHAGDGSGRLFVVDLFGIIHLLREEQSAPENFLDIRDRVERIGEGGLLGLAFHPSYPLNGRFFVYYTTTSDGQFVSRISEFRVSENPQRASSGERIILTIPQPTNLHNAGDLAFGADGMLYISSGDGGPTGDPDGRGQDRTTLLGKILRIDVDGEAPYRVPADNPFVGQEDVRPEIWAYGLRNPFRFSFDRLTGRLFAGDVGEARFEEIDLIERGGNYGWNVVEGNHCYPTGDECDQSAYIAPIHEYARVDGRSVTGGLVYRGAEMTSLWGDYLFADFVHGRIWALREVSKGVWRRRELLTVDFLISGFGEGPNGEVYLAGLVPGRVYKMVFHEEIILPQIADGASRAGVLQSFLLLSNNSDREISGSIDFFAGGQPAELALAGRISSSHDFVLPPHSSRGFASQGVSDPFFVGWARVRSDGRTEAAVLYSLVRPDGSTEEAGIQATEASTDLTLFVAHDRQRALNTGIALANPSGLETAEVELIFLDPAGDEVARLEFQMPPGSHRAQFIDEAAGLGDLFAGTLRIRSTRPLAATALVTRRGVAVASLPVGG